MMPPKETRCAEGRGRPEGEPRGNARVRTQSRVTLPANLARVNEAARRDKRRRFTALLHHVDVNAQERAFRRLKRNAAPGVDGETVTSYEQEVAQNLERLHAQIHSGRYRPQPVRRVDMPKADGGQRPLGVSALEEKIVQSAVAEGLSAIYEVDFLGFSYGFRPGRSPHQALEARHGTFMTQSVNWVLDADVRSFFDAVDPESMLRMVAHRIADRRILRLIRGWLRAGVLEGKRWSETVQGPPQGSGISPLLANIFMHYVLDRWAHQWRKRYARGRVIIVRYCDDFVLGFQYETDARRMLVELKERLARFQLALHEEKTRLIEFGKLVSELRRKDGARRCETFKFLGFTHSCAWRRDGRFVVKRRTDHKRLMRKLKELRTQAQRQMHTPVVVQSQWLCSVLRGHYAYFGLPSNFDRRGAFYRETCRLWYRALNRCSQRQVARTFPFARSTNHSFPTAGRLLTRVNFRKSRVRENRLLGSVRAKAEWLSYSTTTR
jgi:RNA-directed DNA polymerase